MLHLSPPHEQTSLIRQELISLEYPLQFGRTLAWDHGACLTKMALAVLRIVGCIGRTPKARLRKRSCSFRYTSYSSHYSIRHVHVVISGPMQVITHDVRLPRSFFFLQRRIVAPIFATQARLFMMPPFMQALISDVSTCLSGFALAFHT